MRRVLIITNGPVPTKEQTTVEGGGLRAWGLANGLRAQNADQEITVAYNEAFKKKEATNELNDIQISTWTIQTLGRIIQDFDSIIVSYCAGDITQTVIDNIRADQQLILDAYVPIYIEMSARDAADKDREYDAFNFENKIWTRALKRGDIVLCANKNQKDFYTGVLASLGRINPKTYGDDDILKIVPYGVYEDQPVANEKPISKLSKNSKAFKLLWFGGIYPWFDLRSLLSAVKQVNEKIPVELTMVGIRNPFNQHPDFIKKYEDTLKLIKDSEIEEFVHIVDWVDFNTRADWYLDADAVISINNIGPENNYAWRTRSVDYVWSDLPMITNGKDPISNLLEENNALILLENLEAETISKKIFEVANDRKLLANISKNISKVRKQLFWSKVTAPLSKLIDSNYRPADAGLEIIKIKETTVQSIGRVARLKIKVRQIYRKAIRFYRREGLLATMKIVSDKISRKIGRKFAFKKDQKPKIILVSHQLDNTGAPFVAMDLAFEIKKRANELGRQLKFIAFTPIKIENVQSLQQAGIAVEIYTNRDLFMRYNKGDIVILNSFGLSRSVAHSTIQAAEKGTLDAFYWYGHEATPENFVDSDTRDMFTKLLENNRAKLYGVSKGSISAYSAFFSTSKNMEVMTFRFDFPTDRFVVKEEKDFEKLDFVVTGAVSDGRKGQLPILYAFLSFYNNFYKKNPEKYRDFSLKFIGVDEVGYIKKQMEISAKGLGEKCKIIGQIPRVEVLDLVEKANMTICYSYHESMGIFVYEGMAFGHPIIRNDCYGQEEQLIDGRNGWAVSNDDYQTLCNAIEETLNISKTSNKKLAEMSKVSVEIAKKATENKYYIIDDIKEKISGEK